jgi:hypothetical protein
MAEGIQSNSVTGPEFQYVAEYDERGVKQADRAYYLRSLFTIRALTTVGTPGLCLFLIALLQLLPLALEKLGIPQSAQGVSGFLNTATGVLAVVAMLSVGTNIFFFVMRPIGNWAAIRKSPRRTVKADPSGIAIDTGARVGYLDWDRIQQVWQTDRYLMLVIGKFVQISLPKRGMPEGMEEFIKQSAGKS